MYSVEGMGLAWMSFPFFVLTRLVLVRGLRGGEMGQGFIRDDLIMEQPPNNFLYKE